MAKKSRRKPNPVYIKGIEKGFQLGKDKTFEVVSEVLIELCNEKGVGPVMHQKIENAIKRIPRQLKLRESELDE